MEQMNGRSVGRSRWAAIGAAVAVAVGAGGLMTASASQDSGERAVYVPITPCRVMDTRAGTDNVGPRSSPIGSGESYAIAVRGVNGNCTIPADAVGVVMNVAAINPSAGGFLTVYPSDASKPLAANLNWVANQPPLSNAVTADISVDGKVSFFNFSGTVDVAADIVGYYIDHTHDDRYYTETEVNALLAARDASIAAVDARNNLQKAINFNVTTLAFGGGTPNSGSDSGFGLLFADETFDSIHANFVVPQDVTPGTTMKLEVTWHAQNAGCNINLAPNSLYFARPGTAVVAGGSGTSGLASVGSDVRPSLAPARRENLAEFTIDRPTVGGGLLPGDVIDASVYRGGAGNGDSCTGDLRITGVRVLYT